MSESANIAPNDDRVCVESSHAGFTVSWYGVVVSLDLVSRCASDPLHRCLR